MKSNRKKITSVIATSMLFCSFNNNSTNALEIAEKGKKAAKKIVENSEKKIQTSESNTQQKAQGTAQSFPLEQTGKSAEKQAQSQLAIPFQGQTEGALEGTKGELKEVTDVNGLQYKTVIGDPLGIREYTFQNGLKVYLSVNKAEPRIQTAIAVRAGSKNDPADATGLAHYLEHMLFKGTSVYGTSNFAEEKGFIDEIENLFEEYRHITDPEKRKIHYRKIDSVSARAAKLAIANEYDKMMSELGARGTNAFTSFERTVYISDIPSNQFVKWAKLESERFREPILRLFHTELEAVYEEKNLSMDTEDDIVQETDYLQLFPTHPLGTQTTIGTIEHLKNPSMKKIREYYDKYYVPNNMAILLSGDFNPDEVAGVLNKFFGSKERREVPLFHAPEQEPIKTVREKVVLGQEQEQLVMSFRIDKPQERDRDLLFLCNMILSNGKAGLIDRNINQAQKALRVSVGSEGLIDFGVMTINGTPREGQTLEELRSLILNQISALVEGKFDESLLKSTITYTEVREEMSRRSNFGRMYSMLDMFILDEKLDDYVASMQRLKSYPKQEIINFARQHFTAGYSCVLKKKGQRPESIKVDKPEITPIAVERNNSSAFVKDLASSKVDEIKPSFIDFSKEISQQELPNGAKVFHVQNTSDKLFEISFIFEKGRLHDKKIGLALQYLKFLGTKQLTAEQISAKFFGLGASYSINSSEDETILSINGPQEHFAEIMTLIQQNITQAQPDEKALQLLIDGIKKQRIETKNDKYAVQSALRMYGMYGAKNPFNDVLSTQQLEAIKPQELTEILHELFAVKHRILVFSPEPVKSFVSSFGNVYSAPKKLQASASVAQYKPLTISKNRVILVNREQVTAEIVAVSTIKSGYDSTLATRLRVFNQYFGGDMSSLVFQTIRESKALAYSAFAVAQEPTKREFPYSMFGSVSTQADKSPEAVSSLLELFDQMPVVESSLAQAKSSITNILKTERYNYIQKINYFDRMRKMGIGHDVREKIYKELESITINDIVEFQKTYVAQKPRVLMVMADSQKLPKGFLEKYGEIEEVTFEKLFGY